jgi:copper transport protein
MTRKLGWIAFFIMLCSLGADRVSAHAVLDHSNPPAEAVLAQAPAEIRLWFTEPLEPKFSRFTLLDTHGGTVNTPKSQVDSGDPTQMFMQPGPLPDGLYIVLWDTTSAADGHPATGSFEFTIGAAAGTASAIQPGLNDALSWEGIVVRTFYIFSLALLIGAIGFRVIIWNPAITEPMPDAARRMNRLLAAGWVLVGVSSIMMFALILPSDAALGDFLFGTRYGTLWLIGMGLWLIMGYVWWRHRTTSSAGWVVLVVGEVLILTHSLFTHAAATPDPGAAIAVDWLHLSLTVLWLGGLIQLLSVVGFVRGRSASDYGRLVEYFSNAARLTLVSLILTGVYAAWLQIGSIDALTSTSYGQALLIKLALLLPLLPVAGVNMLITARRLHTTHPAWAARLRGLVGAEIALVVGILLAVGALTALVPARVALAEQQKQAFQAQVRPFYDMAMQDAMHIELDISPNQVGTNSIRVTLHQEDGSLITNASAVRLRFTHTPDSLGTSELVLQNKGDGTYTASGQNLAQEGAWRLRLNFQRPDQYDSVVDFKVTTAPAPPPVNDAGSLRDRIVALILLGITLLAIAGYTMGTPHSTSPARRIAWLMAVGGVFVLIGIIGPAAQLFALTK